MAFWGKSASPSRRQHGMADWPGSMPITCIVT